VTPACAACRHPEGWHLASGCTHPLERGGHCPCREFLRARGRSGARAALVLIAALAGGCATAAALPVAAWGEWRAHGRDESLVLFSEAFERETGWKP
jgi:hypothetical protein